MTRAENVQHLTEEEIGEILGGEEPQGFAAIHLAACAACRNEVASLQSSLQSFDEFSMRWAEVEAPRRVQVPSRLALRLGGKPSWGLAFAAAATVFAVGFGLHGPRMASHPQPGAAVAKSAPSALSNAELAADNRLMESIDQELQYQVRPTVPASELRLAGAHGRAAQAMVAN